MIQCRSLIAYAVPFIYGSYIKYVGYYLRISYLRHVFNCRLITILTKCAVTFLIFLFFLRAINYFHYTKT